jgi:hypothetical protein
MSVGTVWTIAGISAYRVPIVSQLLLRTILVFLDHVYQAMDALYAMILAHGDRLSSNPLSISPATDLP